MLQNDNTSVSPTESIRMVGQDNIEQARSQEPSPSTEEKTSNSDTTTENAYVSGAKKARQLGESRRKLAKTLLDAASKSEVAASALKAQLETDQSISKYIRSNWPNEYNKVILGESSSAPFDEESAKIKAKAEVLAEQLEEDRKNLLEDFAVQLSFTAEESDQLSSLAADLEGKSIGGKKLDFVEAMKRASTLIRPDKAKLSSLQLPEGMPHKAVESQERESANESLARARKKMLGGNVDKIKANLEFVDKHLKDNVFIMPLED